MRDNRDLGDRLRVLLQRRDQRVADLVIRDDALFHVSQHRALFLGARDNVSNEKQILLIERSSARWRTARSAASFTRLARSAPTAPAVACAIL